MHRRRSGRPWSLRDRNRITAHRGYYTPILRIPRRRVIHRDRMRREDIATQARVQQQAARNIAKTPGNSALVVDTHMFVRTTGGIWPGTPRKVLEALNPDMIILIEAEPEEIAKRRTDDST